MFGTGGFGWSVCQGKENIADLMTKHLSRGAIDYLLVRMGFVEG